MSWKTEGLADLYRQGFMKPRRSVAAKVPKPIVACSRCSNWHVEGKHTLRRDPCKLPKRGEAPLKIEAHGRTLIVQKSGRDWSARLDGYTRMRFGNAREICEDIATFAQNGTLPDTSGKGWA